MLQRIAQEGFQILNKQIQVNTKMTLKNQLILDLLLVEDKGVCGYLKLGKEHFCIHIPNLINDLQVQMGEMRNAAEDSRDIREAAENNWLNKILHEIEEWSLKGWLTSLLKELVQQ